MLGKWGGMELLVVAEVEVTYEVEWWQTHRKTPGVSQPPGCTPTILVH